MSPNRSRRRTGTTRRWLRDSDDSDSSQAPSWLIVVPAVFIALILIFATLGLGRGVAPAVAPAPTFRPRPTPSVVVTPSPTPTATLVPTPSPVATPSPVLIPSPSLTQAAPPSPTPSPSAVPAIEFDFPIDGEVVQSRSFFVIGTAPPGATITRDVGGSFDSHVTVRDDGIFMLPVQVSPGENRLTFRIGDDRETAVTIVVTYIPSS